eukprot:6211524-Pleurochrysis_carterae.AAC.1
MQIEPRLKEYLTECFALERTFFRSMLGPTPLFRLYGNSLIVFLSSSAGAPPAVMAAADAAAGTSAAAPRAEAGAAAGAAAAADAMRSETRRSSACPAPGRSSPTPPRTPTHPCLPGMCTASLKLQHLLLAQAGVEACDSYSSYSNKAAYADGAKFRTEVEVADWLDILLLHFIKRRNENGMRSHVRNNVGFPHSVVLLEAISSSRSPATTNTTSQHGPSYGLAGIANAYTLNAAVLGASCRHGIHTHIHCSFNVPDTSAASPEVESSTLPRISLPPVTPVVPAPVSSIQLQVLWCMLIRVVEPASRHKRVGVNLVTASESARYWAGEIDLKRTGMYESNDCAYRQTAAIDRLSTVFRANRNCIALQLVRSSSTTVFSSSSVLPPRRRRMNRRHFQLRRFSTAPRRRILRTSSSSGLPDLQLCDSHAHRLRRRGGACQHHRKNGTSAENQHRVIQVALNDSSEAAANLDRGTRSCNLCAAR